jgi:hypothetical protein
VGLFVGSQIIFSRTGRFFSIHAGKWPLIL